MGILEIFEAILVTNLMSKFNCKNNKKGMEKIDQELCDKLNLYKDMGELVDTAFSCAMAACNTAFKVPRGAKHVTKKTTICWWKRTNALQRRYQRTTNNENLKHETKEKYYDGRREYEGKM
jgi:hypothetical protein